MMIMILLILSSHLLWGLPTCIFPSGFLADLCTHLSSFSCMPRVASQKFPGWGHMTVVALPQVRFGVVPCKTPSEFIHRVQRLSHYTEHVYNPISSYYAAARLESLWYPRMCIPLTLAWSCMSLRTQIWFCFWSLSSAAAVPLMIKSSV